MNIVQKLLFCVIFFSASSQAIAQTAYVATNGSDQSGNGSQQNPWATIGFAIDQINDGTTIEVGPGTYNGRVRLDQHFSNGVLIRSTTPYQARLRHNNGSVIICFTCSGITVEGFDIAHSANNNLALVIQIQNSDAFDVTLRNNIIHDSTDNDLLRINNAAHDILVEGNMFYNQAGSDEHIDVNSAESVIVRDNVFFNSRSQAITSSYVIVKDSNGNSDGMLGSKNVQIQRNVFFNWQGNAGQSFVRVGEDGTANFEADNVLIENNLMLGNSSRIMRSAFTVQGSSNVRFQFNTVVGNLPSRSFAARLIAIGDNQANSNIVLSNNIWSDASGTMGAEGFVASDVFDAPIGNNASVTLDNNLYYNGGNSIPSDNSQEVRFDNDANSVVGNPRLGSQNGLILPTFSGTRFGGNFTNIRDVFIDLVSRYGTPGDNSAALNAASTADAPEDDILGARRQSALDIGAVQIDGVTTTIPPDSDRRSVLSWLFLLLDD